MMIGAKPSRDRLAVRSFRREHDAEPVTRNGTSAPVPRGLAVGRRRPALRRRGGAARGTGRLRLGLGRRLSACASTRRAPDSFGRHYRCNGSGHARYGGPTTPAAASPLPGAWPRHPRPHRERPPRSGSRSRGRASWHTRGAGGARCSKRPPGRRHAERHRTMQAVVGERGAWHRAATSTIPTRWPSDLAGRQRSPDAAPGGPKFRRLAPVQPDARRLRVWP